MVPVRQSVLYCPTLLFLALRCAAATTYNRLQHSIRHDRQTRLSQFNLRNRNKCSNRFLRTTPRRVTNDGQGGIGPEPARHADESV